MLHQPYSLLWFSLLYCCLLEILILAHAESQLQDVCYEQRVLCNRDFRIRWSDKEDHSEMCGESHCETWIFKIHSHCSRTQLTTLLFLNISYMHTLLHINKQVFGYPLCSCHLYMGRNSYNGAKGVVRRQMGWSGHPYQNNRS